MRSAFVTGFVLLLGPRGFGSKSGDLVNRTAKKRNRESTPFVFYILAEKLFAVGKKDEAVFWYYAGQLRYRVYLLVNKDKLEPSGDPAAFAALSEEIGRPINEYAFGDIPQLAKTIDAVLAWDESHSNALTPRDKHKSQYDEIVSGLTQMRDQLLQQADSIRKTRTTNGLPNRN